MAEVQLPPVTVSGKPDLPEKTKAKSTTKTTINLTNILKVETKKEPIENTEAKAFADEAFNPEQLRTAWLEFAEQRKVYQAEYQLLSQAYELLDKKVIVHLMHPVQETMLNNLRSELTTYLREKLKNNSIIVSGELKVMDDKKMMYTARDKFDFLAEKNPMLKELKERLGLDTDF